ncbi:hypothetical protein JB92DRAFT_2082739 [Gautieria morchelliformis]|nr:hypothetical protein JB92DRAFT_2082739 [Gautieria morchelliformis]
MQAVPLTRCYVLRIATDQRDTPGHHIILGVPRAPGSSPSSPYSTPIAILHGGWHRVQASDSAEAPKSLECYDNQTDAAEFGYSPTSRMSSGVRQVAGKIPRHPLSALYTASTPPTMIELAQETGIHEYIIAANRTLNFRWLHLTKGNAFGVGRGLVGQRTLRYMKLLVQYIASEACATPPTHHVCVWYMHHDAL